MQKQFLTVSQARDELERRFGRRFHDTTIRKWCQRTGFGVRLTPRGYYYIPINRLNDIEALCSGSMSVDGTVVADTNKASAACP